MDTQDLINTIRDLQEVQEQITSLENLALDLKAAINSYIKEWEGASDEDRQAS